jgi:hypothetical protein
MINITDYIPSYEIPSYFQFVNKLITGELGDIRTLFIGFIFLWFATTNLFNWLFSYLCSFIKIIIVYVIKFIIYIPVQLFKNCCIKNKQCKQCRTEIDDEKVYTPCCKQYFHRLCFVQQLSEKQLTCPGCEEALDKNLYKFNLEAGLLILKKQKQQS